MARLVFPDEGSRLVFRMTGSGKPLLSAAAGVATIYADSAGLTLADIQTVEGVTVVSSTLTVTAASQLPLFLGPDGVDTVYCSVDGGPLAPVYARNDDRLDSLEAKLVVRTVNGNVPDASGNVSLASGAVADASSTVKGAVQLTGDLGGTAGAPTTPTAVHKTGAETVNGVKTFQDPPIVPDSTFTIAKISATGTRDASSFLRGDGTFATPAGAVVDATAAAKGVVQLTGDLGGTAASPTVPVAVRLTGAQTVAGVKTFSSAPVVPDAAFGIAKISATGTRDATTFLRGDGTFAAPPGSSSSGPLPSGDTTGATDTAAIRAHLAANKTTKLAAGVYYISDDLPIVNSFSVFSGAGRATRLEVVAGSTLATTTVRGEPGKPMIRLDSANVDKVTIENMWLYGHRFKASEGGLQERGEAANIGYAPNMHAIELDNTGMTFSTNRYGPDTQHVIQDVYITEFAADGIRLLCGTGANLEQRENKVVNVAIYQCFGSGVKINGPTDNFFSHVTVGDCSSHGYTMDNTANNKFSICKAFYCGNLDHAIYEGFRINGGRNTFVGCESQDNTGNGFYVSQPGNVFMGCIADTNGYGANSTRVRGGYYVATGATTGTGTDAYGTMIHGSALNYRDLQKFSVVLDATAGTSVDIISAKSTIAGAAHFTGTGSTGTGNYRRVNGQAV